MRHGKLRRRLIVRSTVVSVTAARRIEENVSYACT
jgi:hypothetical protein